METVLEIGTQYGGTAAIWCELASNVISVDLPDGPYGGLGKAVVEDRNARLVEAYPHFIGVLGSSHSAEVSARVQEEISHLDTMLDVLFIDGDHTLQGVEEDFQMYRHLVRKGGVVLFHDIVDTELTRSMGVGVPEFWSKLKGTKKEFCIRADWGGLGAWVRR
jgi:predicted O-methyltransferase YrrM